MTRINQPSSATESARQPLLSQIEKAFGTVPNMFKVVSHSPAALKSMWGSFGALGSGKLGPVLGEQLAVAIANHNRCAYCLAAHTVLGVQAGASALDMAQARKGDAADPRSASAIRFALKVVAHRAQVSETDLETLRAAGFDDEAIVEIMAHVALNLFTNYVNVALDVPVDFPSVAFV
jgi:uncharacterized peroxidase-related enzyme